MVFLLSNLTLFQWSQQNIAHITRQHKSSWHVILLWQFSGHEHAHSMRLTIVACNIKEACETESPQKSTFFVLYKRRIFIPKHVSIDFHCMDWIINTYETQQLYRLKLFYRKSTLKTRLNRACLTIWIAGWHSENARSSSGSPQKIPCPIVICWSYKRWQRSCLALALSSFS